MLFAIGFRDIIPSILLICKSTLYYIQEGNYMGKLYRLNKRRGTLHIYGCCQYSKNLDYEQFDSEKEANASVGYHVPLCTRCRQWRDYILERELLRPTRRSTT